MLLSLIHKEFIKHALLKRANYWDTYTHGQQLDYLTLHPKSRKHVMENPHNIAQQLKITYEGYQPEIRKYVFRDPLTQTSFYAKDFEEAELKLEQKQKLFFEKPLKHAATIRAEIYHLKTALAS